MRWEIGHDVDYNDPEVQNGLCETKTQKQKTGYTNDPWDRGGETKFGWAKSAHPNDNIKTITLDYVMGQYKSQYWDTVSGDKLDPHVAKYVFDTSVLFGPARARKFLQEAAGVTVDGIIGPATLKAANAMDKFTLVNRLRDVRIRFHRNTAASSPSQARFLNGWLRRANEVA